MFRKLILAMLLVGSFAVTAMAHHGRGYYPRPHYYYPPAPPAYGYYYNPYYPYTYYYYPYNPYIHIRIR